MAGRRESSSSSCRLFFLYIGNTDCLDKTLQNRDILLPLDVGYFSPLKRTYGREIESLIRTQIIYITKCERDSLLIITQLYYRIIVFLY